MRLLQFLNPGCILQTIANFPANSVKICQVSCSQIRNINISRSSQFAGRNKMETEKKHATKIFQSAVRSVLPREMILNKVKYRPDTKILTIDDRVYSLNNNVYVVGFGKAVMGMARTVDDILHDHIQSGIISIPSGSVTDLRNAGKSDSILQDNSKIKWLEGAKNNLPDEESHQTAQQIEKLVDSLSSKDILLVLISGGGSSLLPSPYPPITLEDEMELIKLLSQKAANIHQLNMVRKNIESLKGGGLAVIAQPAQVISLILSDVIGNTLSDIASGPTVTDPSTPQQCLDLFKNLNIMEFIPQTIIQLLHSKIYELNQNTSCDWSKIHNVIVGSNEIATSAASEEAVNYDYIPFIFSTILDGEARQVGSLFVYLAKFICMVFKHKIFNDRNPNLAKVELQIIEMGVSKSKLNDLVSVVEKSRNTQKGLCLISGGETTVQIKGTGIGGRNQEMVLAAGIEFDQFFTDECLQKFDVCFLSAGTDGQDGPTELAGAVIDQNFVKTCASQGLAAQSYLDNNDSNSLFEQFKDGCYSVKTGLTGTNVMDIQILLVKPQHS